MISDRLQCYTLNIKEVGKRGWKGGFRIRSLKNDVWNVVVVVVVGVVGSRKVHHAAIYRALGEFT